jgi:hypothetical protein
MSVQTTYGQNPARGYPGQFADSRPCDVRTSVAEVAIAAGIPAMAGATTRAECRPPYTPDTADVDAILATGGASAATAQTLAGSALDGVVGVGELVPPRPITLVLSSHANWDLSTAFITGLDEDGSVIVEPVVIPDAGNATVQTQRAFRKVTSIYIPPQAGASGTFTAGFAAGIGGLDHLVHGVALYDASREPEAYPIDYAVPCVRRGRVFVTSETSYVDGDPVFVRMVATGNEVAGHVRNVIDSTDCGVLRRARFVGTGSAGVAVIDLNP